MNGRRDLGLDPIDPPAGGLEALRARVARHERRRGVTRRVIPSLIAAVVLAAAVVIGRGEPWAPAPATLFERDLRARVLASLRRRVRAAHGARRQQRAQVFAPLYH